MKARRRRENQSPNGYSKKSVLTETSKIDIRPARPGRDFRSEADRPLSAALPGFDEKIVSMYARGMTVREIQGHLLELYGLEVSCQRRRVIAAVGRSESAAGMQAKRPPISGAFLLVAVFLGGGAWWWLVRDDGLDLCLT